MALTTHELRNELVEELIARLAHGLRYELAVSRLHYVDDHHKPFHHYYQFACGFLGVAPKQKDNNSPKAGSEPLHGEVHLVAQSVGIGSHRLVWWSAIHLFLIPYEEIACELIGKHKKQVHCCIARLHRQEIVLPFFIGLGFFPTPFPINILPIFVLIWLVVGIGYAYYLSCFNPEASQELGHILRA